MPKLVITRDRQGNLSLWVNPQEGEIQDFFGDEPFHEYPLEDGKAPAAGLQKLQAIKDSTAPEDEELMGIIHALLGKACSIGNRGHHLHFPKLT